MKQELYYYAISLKKFNLANISIVCCWILLSIFLIPLILSNVVLGAILLLVYLFFYFLSKKEFDKYNRELLNFGLFLLFLGIEFFSITIVQYMVIIPFVMTMLIMLISYEILFFIKIIRKRYSKGNEGKSVWGYIVPLMFGGTGIWAGRLIAKSENADFKLWIAILLCSLLITYSLTFFQKYFINKIIN